jgi:hypothetical protein
MIYSNSQMDERRTRFLMSYPAKVYRFAQGPVIVCTLAEETALFHLGFRRTPSGKLREPPRPASEVLRAPEQAINQAACLSSHVPREYPKWVDGRIIHGPQEPTALRPTKPVEARLPPAQAKNIPQEKPVIEPRGRIASAQAWLTARLARGPAPADRVKAESHDAGIAWRTCQLAATRLRVIRRKRSGTEGWTWLLAPRRKVAAGKRVINETEVS